VDDLRPILSAKKLLAFADDIIVRATSIETASKCIKGMGNLSRFGLVLNKSKSIIMAGPTCLKNMCDLEGIPIT
jgi:hypothetical protein